MVNFNKYFFVFNFVTGCQWLLSILAYSNVFSILILKGHNFSVKAFLKHIFNYGSVNNDNLSTHSHIDCNTMYIHYISFHKRAWDGRETYYRLIIWNSL